MDIDANTDAPPRANPSLRIPTPPTVLISPSTDPLTPHSSETSNRPPLLLANASPALEQPDASSPGTASLSAPSSPITLAQRRERRTIRQPRRFINGDWRSLPSNPPSNPTTQSSSSRRSIRRSTQTLSSPPPSRVQPRAARPSTTRRFPPSKDNCQHKITLPMWEEICKNSTRMFFVRVTFFLFSKYFLILHR